MVWTSKKIQKRVYIASLLNGEQVVILANNDHGAKTIASWNYLRQVIQIEDDQGNLVLDIETKKPWNNLKLETSKEYNQRRLKRERSSGNTQDLQSK